MFTDMVGYSNLSQKNERLALELLEEHRKLARPLFKRHNGKEIKTIGDAFLVEFDSVLDAVRCAIDIQKKFKSYNAPLPKNMRIKIRIGVHLGDVVRRDNDLYGDGVNIAARVQAVAEPGGICISEDVYRQVVNKVPAMLLRLGKGELKNIDIPVGIYSVTEQMTGWKSALAQTKFHLKQRKWQAVAVLGIIGLIVLSAVMRDWMLRPPLIKEIPVVMGDIVNQTGDKALDGLSTLFVTSMEQSKDLSVVSKAGVADAVRELGLKPGTRIDETIGRDVCRKVRAPLLITGEIQKFGKKFVVDVRAMNFVTNEYAATVKESTTEAERVAGIIERLSWKLRQALEKKADDVRHAARRADW